MEKGDRSFTVVAIRMNKKTESGGRYISKTPMSAATKAFNQVCRKYRKSKKACSSLVVIRETTSGTKHKMYVYHAKRLTLKTPILVERNGTKIEIYHKTKIVSMKTVQPAKVMKKLIKKGGSGMDMDDNDDDEGIFTGFYNVIGHGAILYTDSFVLPEEKPDSWIIKQILKQHKKEFKKAGIANIKVELFDTMFYPSEEGVAAVKSVLDVQLPIIREQMAKLDKASILAKERNAFDMSSLANLLDTM